MAQLKSRPRIYRGKGTLPSRGGGGGLENLGHKRFSAENLGHKGTLGLSAEKSRPLQPSAGPARSAQWGDEVFCKIRLFLSIQIITLYCFRSPEFKIFACGARFVATFCVIRYNEPRFSIQSIRIIKLILSFVLAPQANFYEDFLLTFARIIRVP